MERNVIILKAGDIVRIRTWESMVDEFPTDGSGRILTSGALFIPSMKKYCEKEFTICGIQELSLVRMYRLMDAQKEEIIPYWFTIDHFDFGEEQIDFSILEKYFQKLI